MPIKHLKCKSVTEVATELPNKLKELSIAAIDSAVQTDEVFIVGVINQRSTMKRTNRWDYMKLNLKALNSDDSINVFVTGSLVIEVDKLTVGDFLVLSAFGIENSTRLTDPHQFQLVLDEFEVQLPPQIWYILKQEIGPNAESESENSIASHSKHKNRENDKEDKNRSPECPPDKNESGVLDKSVEICDKTSDVDDAIEMEVGDSVEERISISDDSFDSPQPGPSHSHEAKETTLQEKETHSSADIDSNTVPKKYMFRKRTSEETGELKKSIHNICNKDCNEKNVTDVKMNKNNVQVPGVKPGLVYFPLNTLKSGTLVNVYGIVKFTKPPYKSRGRDYATMISIVDPTLFQDDKKLKCLLFHRDQHQLPHPDVGDVIRFHRLKIVEFAGDLQGQSSISMSWLYVKGPTLTNQEPMKSSSDVRYTEEDKTTIQSLLEWSQRQNDVCLENTVGQIENIRPGMYLDLVCQVVGVCCIPHDNCVVLRVWDGTKTVYMVRNMEAEMGNREMSVTNTLVCRAKGMMYDVSLYDDHYVPASKVKPGDVIKLGNLHAAVYKDLSSRIEESALPMVELVVHRGMSFGRGVYVLSNSSPDSKGLLEHLAKVAPEYETSITEQEAIDILFDHSMSDSQGSTKINKSSKEKNNLSASQTLKETKKQNEGSSGVDIESGNLTSESENNDSGRQGKHNRVLRLRSDLSMNHEANTSQEQDVTSSLSQIAKRKIQSHCDSPDKTSHKKRKTGSEVISTSGESGCDNNENSCRNSQDSQELEFSCDQEEIVLSNESQKKERCLLKTKTVILDHHHIKRTHIKKVLEHQAPSKFRILGYLQDYHPHAANWRELLLLYCPQCNFIHNCNENDLDKLTVNRLQDDCIEIYECPRCTSADDITFTLMEYVYALRLLLKDEDDSSLISVNVFNKEAEKFFQDILATDVIKSLAAFQDVIQMLDELCCKTEKNPLLECCIQSYRSNKDTNYSIFDTVIV